MMDISTQCLILVLLEMGLSFFGIVCNLLIVTTIRQYESLKGSTLNFLLLNLCLSNLLIAFLVKPISAIYVGYAMHTGEHQVSLAFCTLYTFTYRTTWCVFPLTLTALCWCKLLIQLKCGALCTAYCCPNVKDENEEEEIEHSPKVDQKLHSPSPVAFTTEIAPQQQQRALLMRESLSTPTPSLAAAEMMCRQVSQGSGAKGDDTVDVEEEKKPKGHKRTMEAGPTARQKLLVAFIWISSAFFGITTCFPDKVFGVEFSQKILEDQLKTIAPIPSLGTPRDADLTYCTVKTGLNDMLDYIALMVALVIPLIMGPFLTTLLQTFIFMCSRCLFSSPLNDELRPNMQPAEFLAQQQQQQQQNDNSGSKGPRWSIIISFTIVFLFTYPFHMYVAEVYVEDDFTFLFLKYFVGFLFVLLVPIITLTLEKDIRIGMQTVLGGTVICPPQKQQQQQQDKNVEGNEDP